MNFDPSRKTADLLSICIKAGKAVKGFDSACEAAEKGTASCLLTASDASDKTVKEAVFTGNKYSVPVYRIILTKDEIARLCGKSTAVVAVTDKGFAEGFRKIISQSEMT
ncbi:MAG: ribosomal L7Ae/L30e/S12e/Gadd45 family protein [Ruminococcus sp.]|nr:ribosomal L7Ae/L30e/S12e/Gadd45 family protein [Ruminococcus sp.]